MLVIKVEDWPHGNPSEAKEIGRAYIISNDRGDGYYDVDFRDNRGNTWQEREVWLGALKDFPNIGELNVWYSVYGALDSVLEDFSSDNQEESKVDILDN
mgnify:CR=1 FL=1